MRATYTRVASSPRRPDAPNADRVRAAEVLEHLCQRRSRTLEPTLADLLLEPPQETSADGARGFEHGAAACREPHPPNARVARVDRAFDVPQGLELGDRLGRRLLGHPEPLRQLADAAFALDQVLHHVAVRVTNARVPGRVQLADDGVGQRIPDEQGERAEIEIARFHNFGYLS